MKIAYFDAPSGISGDMTVGALLDAGGLSVESLATALECLEVGGYRLETERVSVTRASARPREGSAAHVSHDGHASGSGVSALAFRVLIDEAAQYHRDWATIRRMIEAAGARGLSAGTVERALAIFGVLAEAEAEVHEVPVDRVHFHEVGAVDSIVDIVGTAWCLDRLGIDRCFTSPVPSGSGYVMTSHGRLPVPAPATASLLRGFDVVAGDGVGELVTPTGAAILAGTAKPLRPAFRLDRIGTGAGTMRLDDRPNVLRVFIGDAEDATDENVVQLEADIDDMTPEALAYAAERLRVAGARDVSIAPLVMKKGRPGHRLTVLCDLAQLDALAGTVLTETTSIGVRYRALQRDVLARRTEVVTTEFGPIRVKVAVRPDGSETAEPEFEDLARAARESGKPLAELREAVLKNGLIPFE